MPCALLHYKGKAQRTTRTIDSAYCTAYAALRRAMS